MTLTQQTLKDAYPYYAANKPVYANKDLAVVNKFSGQVATHVALASPDVIDGAIAAAAQAAGSMAQMPAYKRQEILQHCVTRFTERADELAYSLCVEAGKPIRDAQGEVGRLIDTFRIAAEEATRINGEVLALDISARAHGYQGMTRKVPIGPCSFISPFNFPLNLAAHKVAPALAMGCPFVLKPASLTPIGALLMGEVLAETDLPEGAFSILPCTRANAGAFTTDERLKLLSFTGSQDVGWDLKAQAGKKQVILELGGNAACVIDEGSDVDDVVNRLIIGAFYQSGQSCISVQRIIIHESLYEPVKLALIKATKALVAGDPIKENTFIGPMISVSEAERVERSINEALDKGATLLCGGDRDGAMVPATLLENVPRDTTLYREEIFGPVALLSSFSDFDAALDEVNDSRFGLQAGVFTQNLYRAQKAWEHLDVGGVVIGDVPSWRVDHMPYGGVKDSGIGREGVRYAMEDMSETRLMVIRTP